MFVELVESESIDVDRGFNFLQEPTCRAHVLYYKMTEREDDIAVVRGEDVVNGSIAQRNRNELEGHFFNEE